MAEIVVLNKWRDQRRRRPQVRLGQTEESAEIVFFTGVRYERFDDWMDGKLEKHAVYAE
jgi:hypothetical protein